MSNAEELRYLESTMTSLAAYLMVANQKHPRYILGRPDSNTTNAQALFKMRVSAHYVAALRAYGIPENTPELRWVASWYRTPFPEADDPFLYAQDMRRLEGLLHLEPYEESVQPRLHQLIKQRQGTFFEIPRDRNGTSSPVRDTLWVLRVLMLARERYVLNPGLISDNEIATILDAMTGYVSQDRDKALALRLYWLLNGRLEPNHESILVDLLSDSQRNGNVWGVKQLDKVADIIEALHRSQLTTGLIDDREDTLRDIILTTCYVVESLSPLAREHSDVHSAITQAVDLWWKQFAGEDAPETLAKFFPSETAYLVILSRTLCAVSNYIDGTPKERFAMEALRKQAQRYVFDKSPEIESIEKALQRWINIEVGDLKRLELGFSGANVVRIRPDIKLPITDQPLNGSDLSLVVKYGPIEEIKRERRNYDLLPGTIQPHFVRIPQESYTTPDQQAFVIMEDLSDYRTFFEIYDEVLLKYPRQISRKLGHFLTEIHKGSGQAPREAQNKHLRDIYILPMLQDLDQIVKHAEFIKGKDLLRDYPQDYINDIENMLQQLITRIKFFAGFPLAFMHGDLHTRNIMVHYPNDQPVLTFRLIDLEKTRAEGDAAHDAGQLLTDIELLPVSGFRSKDSSAIHDRIERLHNEVTAIYLEFARLRGDDTFAARMHLAQARALLRINKSRFKRGMRYLDSREYQRADDTLINAMALIAPTHAHLSEVYNDISAEQ